MFTLEDVFKSLFPQIEGLSWDLGTAICGMLMLGFILMAVDILKTALGYRIADWMADQQLSGMGELNKLRRKASVYQNSATGDYYSMKYKQALRAFDETRDRTVRGDVGPLALEESTPALIEKDDWTSVREDVGYLEMEHSDDRSIDKYDWTLMDDREMYK